MNRYDLEARIAAITATESKWLESAKILLESVLKALPADHPAVTKAREEVARRQDKLEAIKDGTLFWQQPWLLD